MTFQPRIVLITTGINPVSEMFMKAMPACGVVQCMDGPDLQQVDCLLKFKEWLLHVPFRMSLLHACRYRSIPYLRIGRGGTSRLNDWLEEQRPDLIVIYSMPYLLQRSTLEIPRIGVLNLHPSLLPSFRGPDPWYWMYRSGQLTLGVTLHWVSRGEDTGDVISQATYRVWPGITSSEMQQIAIGCKGVELIRSAIERLQKMGDLPAWKQPAQSPTCRAKRVGPSDDLIDWHNWSVLRVWHVLRGTQSWIKLDQMPRGLFYGRNWTVGGFKRLPMSAELRPGHVYRRGLRHYLACRDGIIWLHLPFRLKDLVLQFLKVSGIR